MVRSAVWLGERREASMDDGLVGVAIALSFKPDPAWDPDSTSLGPAAQDSNTTLNSNTMLRNSQLCHFMRFSPAQV